jgi:hypothetical protein
LQQLAGRQPALSVKPFEGYGQDPAEWLHEFERAARAQGMNEESMFDVVGSYLLGDAALWFDTANLQGWRSQDGVIAINQAFRSAFVDRYRTRGNILQWHLELDQRSQQAEESVEQYARAIQRLLRRVDPNQDMTEGTRIHTFLRGLRPDLQLQMVNYLTCRDDVTFSDAVAAAQQYEKGQTAHLQATAGIAPTPPTPLAAVAAERNDPLDQLARHVERLLQPMLGAVGALDQRMAEESDDQHYPPWSYSQQQQGGRLPTDRQKPRPPRGMLTCYRCGQPGHVARVCPNDLPAQQQPTAPMDAYPARTCVAPPQASPPRQAVSRSAPNCGCARQPTEGHVPRRIQPQASPTVPDRPVAPHPEVAHFGVGSPGAFPKSLNW